MLNAVICKSTKCIFTELSVQEKQETVTEIRGISSRPRVIFLFM